MHRRNSLIKNLIVFACLLQYLVHPVSSIRCVQKVSPVDCGILSGCLTAVIPRGGFRYIIKDCAPKWVGCEIVTSAAKLQGTTVETCDLCYTDYCNSAKTLHDINLWCLLAALVITYYAMY